MSGPLAYSGQVIHSSMCSPYSHQAHQANRSQLPSTGPAYNFLPLGSLVSLLLYVRAISLYLSIRLPSARETVSARKTNPAIFALALKYQYFINVMIGTLTDPLSGFEGQTLRRQVRCTPVLPECKSYCAGSLIYLTCNQYLTCVGDIFNPQMSNACINCALPSNVECTPNTANKDSERPPPAVPLIHAFRHHPGCRSRCSYSFRIRF